MFQFYEYTLPFQQPLITGAGTFSHRTGVLICFQEGNRCTLSEASPLTGFSAETLDGVKNALIQHHDELNRFFTSPYNLVQLNHYLDELPSFPSLQFGISFLGAVILSQRKEIPLEKLLGLNRSSSIAVNDVIGQIPPNELYNRLKKSIQCGFDILKLKAVPPVDNLAAILTEFHKLHPRIRFRLDANQSWPRKELKLLSSAFTGLPVEYVEEPLPINSVSDLHSLQKECTLPLAVDESIRNTEHLGQLLSGDHKFYAVIKPMMLGNFLKIAGTIARYRSKFDRIVVTTSLESAIGRSMTATTASLIGDKSLSHGLNTGKFFTQDLFTTPDIINGHLFLSEFPFRNISADALTEKHLNRFG
jgi:o-succinylbenzoate synthase